MNLSVTIIGNNEVDHLRELLPQLKWATEIVYVDCESQDDSLEVARDLGCRVFLRPQNTNLNVNKSFAVDQSSGDWVFYPDPDERLPELLAMEIEKTLENTVNTASRLKRRNHYLDTGCVTEVNIRTHSCVYFRKVLPASLTNMYMKNW